MYALTKSTHPIEPTAIEYANTPEKLAMRENIHAKRNPRRIATHLHNPKSA
ncbi:MAG: hypothetical protein JKY61_01460 [Planctomycetes bacterium]|nr:hypothetical protein [Planctomycetota bacterium]